MLTKDEMIDQMMCAGLSTGYYWADTVKANVLKKLLKHQLYRVFQDYMTTPDIDLHIVAHDGVYRLENGVRYYYGGVI